MFSPRLSSELIYHFELLKLNSNCYADAGHKRAQCLLTCQARCQKISIQNALQLSGERRSQLASVQQGEGASVSFQLGQKHKAVRSGIATIHYNRNLQLAACGGVACIVDLL